MARRRLYIPEEVKNDIQKHLKEKYPFALEGFFSGNEDEDTLTGDLGATLRVKNQKVYVKNSQIELPGNWTWSINYHKFRGRGPGATENKLGADGIFELTLKIGSRVEKKTLMFQSKINWTTDANLVREALKLTTWREAAFILNFTADQFEAIDLDSVLASKGRRTSSITPIRLDNYIGTTFLDCIVGDVDLRYDAISRKLSWRTIDGQVVATQFSVPHKITIQIAAPNKTSRQNLKFDKEIRNDEIHNYRMDTTEEEVLSLSDNYTVSELKKARAAKALIYHSDKYQLGDRLLDQLLHRRMQEINVAHDKLKERIKIKKSS